MYRIALETIDNVAVWPLISLSIFFAFFLTLLVHVFTARKSFIARMKNLPFEDGQKNPVIDSKSMIL